MNLKEKRLIVGTLIALAKASKLNAEQREKVFNVINKMENASEMQKERFIVYYGFDGKGCKKLVELAKLYGKTSSTIRGSVISMELKLAKTPEAFEVIESIVNECVEKV